MIVLRLFLNIKLFWRFVCILYIAVWYGIRDVTGRVAQASSKVLGVPKKNRFTTETEFPSPG